VKTIRLSLIAFVTLAIANANSYQVTLGTSSLIGHPAGPFSIGFEFADGSGIGDGNNAVFLNTFNFGVGGPSGLPLTFGSVGGNLSSSVVMTDAAPVSVFVQPFTPGSSLSFVLDITTNVDAGGTPDVFIMSILDNTFAAIPTTAASPLSPFLEIDLDSSNPTVQTFSGDPTRLPAGGGGSIQIAEPTITAVPEASDGSLIPGLLTALCIVVWQSRRCARKPLS
jgi:hypothetical protein